MKQIVLLIFAAAVTFLPGCKKEKQYKADGRMNGVETTLTHTSPRTGEVLTNVYRDYYRKGEDVKIDIGSTADIQKIDVVNLNTAKVLSTLEVNGKTAAFSAPVSSLNIPLGQRASLAFNLYFNDAGADGFDYPSMKTISFDVISDIPSIVSFKSQSGSVTELKTKDYNISGFTEDAKRGIVATFKPGAISYLDIESSSLLNFGTNSNFSVSFWIQSTDNADDPAVMGTMDWNSSNNKGWLIAWLGGRLRVAAGNGAGTKVDFRETVATASGAAWHFVTVTFNRSNEAVLYVDGVRTAGAVMTPVDIDNGKTVKINQDGTGTYSPRLGAKYASVVFYNYALSAAEVMQLYNTTK